MLRAIPLPDETFQSLKLRNSVDPLQEFRFRMRLWELDEALRTDPDDMDRLLNEIEIEQLVVGEDWPTC